MESVPEELRVLLQYLVKHNQDHATELMDLAVRVKEQGYAEAYDHMVKGVDLLDESNRSLQAALTALGD